MIESTHKKNLYWCLNLSFAPPACSWISILESTCHPAVFKNYHIYSEYWYLLLFHWIETLSYIVYFVKHKYNLNCFLMEIKLYLLIYKRHHEDYVFKHLKFLEIISLLFNWFSCKFQNIILRTVEKSMNLTMMISLKQKQNKLLKKSIYSWS